MTRFRIHAASIAIASDGSIVANVRSYAGETDPEALLRRAIESGGTIFIGIRLRAGEALDLRSRIEDAGHEEAGAALVGRERRRKGKAERAGELLLPSEESASVTVSAETPLASTYLPPWISHQFFGIRAASALVPSRGPLGRADAAGRGAR